MSPENDILDWKRSRQMGLLFRRCPRVLEVLNASFVGSFRTSTARESVTSALRAFPFVGVFHEGRKQKPQ